ncbi:MAG: DMT family transporter [Polaromonas sp.]|uniref:DMT family transporter n=1 Tax=Polaromonas sp. TaxID=1869339 RepID=UPI002736A821|nr:DMT family transporter [Polaromonas sp.]MDP2818387.1 DMT family transporter [Polaromonas sp.]
MNRILAYACLALSMSLVGSYVALSKPLVAIFPVFLLAWLRFGIGGAAMLHWLKKPAGEAPMTRQTRQLVFLESFLGNFLFSICMLYGVSLSSAVAAGVIMAAIPAVVAVLSWLFLRERISPRVWLAVACAVLGIALVSLSKTELLAPVPYGLEADLASKTAWLGNLLLLGAVFCEAAYAVIGKKLTGALGAKRITALINLWGFVLVTPMGLWLAWGFDFAAVAPTSWLLLVFYALAASVWTVWLWMTGLKGVPASRAGVFTVMLPISAALVGVFVLGEPMGAAQLAAFALALAGVMLATLPERAKNQAPPSACK